MAQDVELPQLPERASSAPEQLGSPGTPARPPHVSEGHPVRPEPAPRGKPRRRFVRGSERPRGVVWFGLRSFWGHLRHLAASAIATEDIDSRDWMTPDEPRDLMRRIASVLGAPH